jgi:hypothetical protein
LYGFRTTASELATARVALAAGGGTGSVIAVAFRTTPELLSAAISTVLSEADASDALTTAIILDIQLASLDGNIYRYFKHQVSEGSGGGSSGIWRLRSGLVRATIALSWKSTPLDTAGWVLDGISAGKIVGTGGVVVTLESARPYATNLAAYRKVIACSAGSRSSGDGSIVVAISCPLGEQQHTCDLASHGPSGYVLHYMCPIVVPVCLRFNDTARYFDTGDCRVEQCYGGTAVSCACSKLGIFALGEETAPPQLAFETTPKPTSRPTMQPTPHPTWKPLIRPTPRPTRQPTPRPTRQPTKQIGRAHV